MTLRCKPNQLCMIKFSVAGNKGKLITTGINVGQVDFKTSQGEIVTRGNVWTVKGDNISAGENFTSLKRFFPDMDGLFPDDWLQPINDPDLNMDDDVFEIDYAHLVYHPAR